MTESYKQFEEWFDEYSDKNDIRLAINYGAYEIAGDAWQHQQQRIDELESKLNIAVDALKAGEKLIDDISLFLIAAGVPKGKINYDNDSLLKKALKQIEVK